MKNSIKIRLVFFMSLIMISFLIGVIYSIIYVDCTLIGTDLIESFKIISLNSLLIEITFISISILFSSILIGEFVYIFFLFFKSFSLGLIAYSFIGVYSFKGLILTLLHLLINSIYIFNIIKFIINKYIGKKVVDSNILLKTIVKISTTFAIYTALSIIVYLNNTNIISIYKLILGV